MCPDGQMRLFLLTEPGGTGQGLSHPFVDNKWPVIFGQIPKYGMRIIDLFEADDPIDLDAFRKRKETPVAPVVPDELKFKGAVAKQRKERGESSGAETLSDVARDIILRNMDAVFSGQQLPPEDKKTLTTILQAWDAFSVMERRQLVQKVLTLYHKEHKIIAYKHRPSKKDAYLKDDPSLAIWRLQIGDDVKTYDNEEDLDLYVLTTILKDAESWSEDDKKKLANQIERLRNPNPDNVRYTEPEQHFDPMQRPTKFDDEPDEDAVLPSVEKLLQRYGYDFNSNDDRRYWISLDGFNYNTGKREEFVLQFHNAQSPPRYKRFASLSELEQWVLSHQAGIETWFKRQETVQHTDAARIKFAERKMVAMIREVISGHADPEKLKKEGWGLVDDVIPQITNKKVRDLLASLGYDLMLERNWKFFEEYHLTWLPERIQELLREPD